MRIRNSLALVLAHLYLADSGPLMAMRFAEDPRAGQTASRDGSRRLFEPRSLQKLPQVLPSIGVNPSGWTPQCRRIGLGCMAYLFLYLPLSKQLSVSALHLF